ncbi:helix-turn-helix domain-containing protein [uncultured Acetobacteroides sp.]|uniref:helix-turn-helix domain-containing protein n=1 Tax=uncultured Acetobacteroides sp. TaxID=1760811 RepID=UPI0029F460A1|nr:helix-turn-helix domain-containing protein [uncultured Acetobacteroides sp.]
MEINDNTPLAFLTVGQLRDVIRKELARREEPQKPRELRENMSVAEAAEMLNNNGYKLTKSTLYYMTSKRQIPHSKFGRKVVFSEPELLDWAAKKKKTKSQFGG